MAERPPIIYTPTRTAAQFITNPTTYSIGIGERGSGKTSCGVWAMYYHTTARVPRIHWPVVWAVVRDTRVNLGRTTAKTIKEWFPAGEASRWRGKEDQPEWCEIYDRKLGPLIQCWFFGCDNPKDLSDFQSLELGGLWIEEPAPAGDLSGGIDATVFGMGVSSSRGNPYFRCQITMNPPDPRNWTVACWPDLLDDQDDIDAMARPEIPADVMDRFRAESRVFKWSRDENQGERKAPGYLQRVQDALLMSGRADLVDRLVLGKVRSIQIGEPVTPEFNADRFVVPELPPVSPRDRLMASWDGGHQPACVIWRPRPGRSLEVLAAFQAEHAGMLQFVQAQVLPWLAVHVPDGVAWMHTGDPNLKTGDMGNSEESAFKVIMKVMPPSKAAMAEVMGSGPRGRPWQPSHPQEPWTGWIQGPVSKADREEPVHQILHPGWQPRLLIDRRSSRPLITALEGGWRRKKDASGTMIAADWVKNLEANTAEAFAYGCALFVKRRDAGDVMSRWRQQMSSLPPTGTGGSGTNV